MMMKFGLMKVMAYGEFTIIFGLSICSCLTVCGRGALLRPLLYMVYLRMMLMMVIRMKWKPPGIWEGRIC